jgi:diguanylate cyclase (GGDEF)-like protein/PAS domain S-box-containing protein
MRSFRLRLDLGHEFLRAIAQGSTLFGLILIGVVWASVNFHLERERVNSERAAIQNSANLAGAFEEHLSRSLNEIDRSIKIVRMDYSRAPDRFDLRSWLKSNPLFDDQTLQVSIIDRNGIIKLSSVASSLSVGIDLRDREHFQFQANASSDELFISKPVIGRTTGKWSVQVTRRIENADGTFGGMIVVSLDPAYLARFYSSVSLGADGYVRVVGVDGVIRAVGGGKSQPIGKNLNGADLFQHFPASLSRWYYTSSKFSDRVPRLVTFQSVKNYPLIITIGLATDEIFTSVHANRRTYYLIASVISVLILLVIGFGVRGRLLRNRMTRERDTQNRRLDAVLTNMPLGVSLVDEQGRLALSNDRYRSMYDMPTDLMKPGTSVGDILRHRANVGMFAGDPRAFYQELTKKLARGQLVKITSQLGNGRIISVLNQPMTGGGWVSIHEDITEQHAAKEHLEQTKRFLDSVIESVPIPIVVKDIASRRFVLVNQAFEGFFGRGRDQLIGKTALDIYPQEAAKIIDQLDDEAAGSKERQVNADISVVTPVGGDRSVTTTRLVVSDARDKPQYIIIVIEDITDKKEAHAKIAHMAHHDPLTGLPNRTRLTERLNEALANVSQGPQLAVLFLDLDHFKTVNDTLGHLVGDELLRVVAERLQTCVKDTDMVARLGGDEFAIIQTMIDGPEDVSVLADQVRTAITAPYDLGGLRAMIDVSIGIACAPRDTKVAGELIKRADLALYKAKGDGRGRHRFFEPEMDARMRARRALETDLRNAIVNGEFRLFYQPIVNIQDGQIDGVEALLRWEHPERGLVSPGEFISVAEETGLIVPLGEWVIRQACAEAAHWPAHIKIAVNLSPVQFSSQNLVNVVLNALAASRVAPERLELEITEEILLGHSPGNLSVLQRLRSIGVGIVMDDFGTGYSSLNYLRNFAFDKIKIDRSFVNDLSTGNELSLSIVQTVAKLAKVLKVPTTAEGVETTEQLELVRAAGCTHFQGYLFSRPQPAAEVGKILAGCAAAAQNAA